MYKEPVLEDNYFYFKVQSKLPSWKLMPPLQMKLS